MEESLRKKKAMYRQIFVLTWPIVIQNLLNAAVNSADVIMLNYVGQDSLAAGSLAAQYTSLIFMLFYGIGTGVTMLCAQYYGKGDMVAVHKVEGIALRFSIIISFICSCLGFFCPEVIMRIFTNEEALITLGAEYLRIVAPCFVLWGITEAYKAVLRSVGRVTIITVINGIALSLNIFLNAVFIFGLFGLPQMGIRGVALATALARLIELLIAIGISLTSKDAKMVIKPIFQKNPLLMKDFLTMALPAIGNDMIWNLAFAMYSVIIGHLGSDVVAANSIVSVVRNLGCVFCYAIAASSGILVGQVLGENRIEDGREMGRIMLKLALIAGVVGGVIVLCISPFVMDFADITENAKKYLRFMLLINSYYITGISVNSTLIAGVFRAGGDSKFGLICDTIDMWLYAVPLGFIAAFLLKLPVEAVYFLLCTDEFVKWPWVFKRFHSYKWAKNITRENV